MAHTLTFSHENSEHANGMEKKQGEEHSTSKMLKYDNKKVGTYHRGEKVGGREGDQEAEEKDQEVLRIHFSRIS